MRTATANACKVKASLFGVCGAGSVATCQYCGRPFCEKHGDVFEDAEGIGQEVCSRKECVAKRQDLDRHLVYRQFVGGRNGRRLCGIADCEGELAAQCVRCKGTFCGAHVAKREEAIFENQVRVHRMATLCHHCWARRPIWTKT